jgi:predicted glycosyltransferase
VSRIGWYVHHHGSGHLGRLRAIAPHLDSDVLCFSSLTEPADLPANCTWIQLDRDDTAEPETGGPLTDRDPTAGGLLHWAPLLHSGHRRRLTHIASVLEERPVSAFVVDVSAEVTLFVRLLGIPTVLITQPGTRDDTPHRLAFQAATTIIAPWPGELLSPDHLEGLPVVYVGGISRFENRAAVVADRSGVLVLGGAGGSDVTATSISDAAATTPGLAWTALGIAAHPTPGHGTAGTAGTADTAGAVTTSPAITWSADPWDDLARAEIVVAFAGQNSIADLATANVNAVVIPQPRPFEEQAQTAAALGHAGLAIVEPVWPAADAWPGVLDRAQALRPDWSRWRTAGAAQRAAAAIDATARGERP